jgi:signal peptidase II
VSEPARSETETVPRPALEIRVGSATNALQPVSSAERSLAAGPSQWLSLVLVVLAAVGADQLTKQTVSSALALGDSVDVLGPFSIHHVRNSGIAFGLFSSATAIVIAVTTLAVALMLLFFARSGQRHPLLPVALGLVLGGSVANLLDRVRLGYVTDFLDFDHWPAFNLADTFIVVGVALLFVSFVAADRTSPRVGSAPLSRL